LFALWVNGTQLLFFFARHTHDCEGLAVAFHEAVQPQAQRLGRTSGHASRRVHKNRATLRRVAKNACIRSDENQCTSAVDQSENSKMKTRGFVGTLFAVFAFAAPLLNTLTAAPAQPDNQQRRYVAKLISPRAGEIVVPGQKVTIVWEASLPKLPVDVSWCEAEIYLSLDGGKTFPVVITPLHLDPIAKAFSFDWIVPNMPTAAAMIDIRFGCEQFFVETPSVQRASPFVIGQAATH